MKKILYSFLVLGVLALPMNLQAAPQVKLKFAGSIYTDGSGAALNNPVGVTVAADRLYIADSGARRILTFRLKDGKPEFEQVLPLPGMFPMMVQPAADGGLYVLDGRERQIVLVGPAGKVKGKFTPKGMPGKQTIVPRSLRKTPDGSLLILDIFSGRVLVFDEQGNFLRQIGFPEQKGAFADVTMDRSGTLYLLDSVKAVVYSAPAGAEEFAALTPGMEAQMNFPVSLDTDDRGALVLVDRNGSGLAIVGTDGSFGGRRLAMGWNDGQLYYPNQVSIGGAGLFIADTQNNRVQHFSLGQ